MTTSNAPDSQNPNPQDNSSAPQGEGSVVKGVLLNVGINLFICLIWIPLCSGGSSSGGDDIATMLGIIFFFGMFWLGLSQLIHVIPMAIYLGVKKQGNTLRGVLWAAGITFIIWLVFILTVNWY